MSKDRRRSPRVELLGRVHGHVASLDVPVTVTEMSLGGLGLETGFPFPAGAIHDFRLTLGDGAFVVVKGKVVHCRNVAAPGGPSRYVSGVQFVEDDAADDARPDAATERSI